MPGRRTREPTPASALLALSMLGLAITACGREGTPAPEGGSSDQPPTAVLLTGSTAGDTTRVFQFDAGDCEDAEDEAETLEVRWDWNGDGIWDTPYSTVKSTTHRFAAHGRYTVRLEVRDSAGGTDTADRLVRVVDPDGMVEETGDILGLHGTCPNAVHVIGDLGARVINLPDEETFFVLWLPEAFTAQADRRVLVALHGTGGYAYAEVDAEQEMAAEYQHGVVALQWFLGPSAYPDHYLEPNTVHDLIDLALLFMETRYGAQPQRSAYVGFSRGSAISYEVTFWDRRKQTDYFALTISHSGGVNPEGHRPFFDDLVAGSYGSEPFAGTHFYMYCSQHDEQWPNPVPGEPSVMVDYMTHARDLMSTYGAEIERFICDADSTASGGHAGYRNPAHDFHETAITTWRNLTP